MSSYWINRLAAAGSTVGDLAAIQQHKSKHLRGRLAKVLITFRRQGDSAVVAVIATLEDFAARGWKQCRHFEIIRDAKRRIDLQGSRWDWRLALGVALKRRPDLAGAVMNPSLAPPWLKPIYACTWIERDELLKPVPQDLFS